MPKFSNIIEPSQKDDWYKAGKIASEVREWSKHLIKPNAKLLDIANAIEAKIRENSAVPAFPVNLSLNETAAHYTPIKNDAILLTDQIIKIDIGVCYNGAIGDTAYTIDLSGKRMALVQASEAALTNIMKILKQGMEFGEIGKVIADTIISFGFQPVCNLSGHGMALHAIHIAPTIPNYNTGDKNILQKGMIIAIEPFATDGSGKIKDSGEAVIYEEILHKPVRGTIVREIAKEIEKYQNLPFARRWLDEKFGVGKVSLALHQLKLNGNIREHPPLVEISKGMISQAEHTFLIDDEIVCLTL